MVYTHLVKNKVGQKEVMKNQRDLMIIQQWK